MRSAFAPAVIVVLAIACGPSGSSSSGSASVSGTLLGKTFSPADAGTYTQNGNVFVVLSDSPGVCGDLASNNVKPSS
ncbi:MAG: hypothetical protein ACRENE_16040, partial [Polyangiaceae bacterium]